MNYGEIAKNLGVQPRSVEAVMGSPAANVTPQDQSNYENADRLSTFVSRKSALEDPTAFGHFTDSQNNNVQRAWLDDSKAVINEGLLKARGATYDKAPLSDEGRKHRIMANKVGKVPTSSLKDYLNHPTLFEHYPELADVKVSEIYDKDFAGSYNPKTNTIGLNHSVGRSPYQKATTLMHEVQHIVQTLDGVTDGTTPASEGAKIMSTAVPGFMEEFDWKDKKSMSSLNDLGMGGYLKNEGEVEARFTGNFYGSSKQEFIDSLKEGENLSDVLVDMKDIYRSEGDEYIEAREKRLGR